MKTKTQIHLFTVLFCLAWTQYTHAMLLPDWNFPDEDSRKLEEGDLSVLVRYKGDVRNLWGVFDASVSDWFGRNYFAKQGGTEENQLARLRDRNREIRRRVSEMLQEIPNHAEFIRDIIEDLSEFKETPDNFGERTAILVSHGTDRYFAALASLKSPEAMQILMSYLEDERQVGNRPVSSPAAKGPVKRSPNWYVMVRALDHELGEESPVHWMNPWSPSKPKLTESRASVSERLRQDIRLWWDSPKAAQYWPKEKLASFERQKQQEKSSIWHRWGLINVSNHLGSLIAALLGSAGSMFWLVRKLRKGV